MDKTLGQLAEIAALTFQGLLDYCAVSTVGQPGEGDPTVIEVLAPTNGREQHQAGSGKKSVHTLQRHLSQYAQLKVEHRIKARWRRSTACMQLIGSATAFQVVTF